MSKHAEFFLFLLNIKDDILIGIISYYGSWPEEFPEYKAQAIEAMLALSED